MTPNTQVVLPLNTLFPGLSNYIGPTLGWFTLLHHEGPLAEWSDNVLERIDYINKHKPKDEIDIRLRHIVYFPKGLFPKFDKAYLEYDKARSKYEKACSEYDKARSKYKKASSKYDKKVLAYLKKHIPDCQWNGRELEFNDTKLEFKT